MSGSGCSLTRPNHRRLGQEQEPHEYLYWEFHERGFDQAVRVDNWKGVKRGLNGKVELYDLSDDIGEEKDIAGQHPEVVRRIERIMREARTDSKDFPVSAGPAAGQFK